MPGILLGDELYQHTLRVFVGSDVDIACPLCGIGPMGPMPKLKSFRVAGHFYTGMYEFDSKLAYVALSEAQKFLHMPGEVTGVEVRTTTPEAARAVADEIARRLGPGYEVRTWEELNRGLFAALKLEKVAMFVVLTFIALVASFSIVSNLIMLVTEKAKEVAILKSMGARDGAILRVFFAEGLYIGLLGLALGLALGIGGCLMLGHYGLPLNPDVYYIQKLPVVMRVSENRGGQPGRPGPLLPGDAVSRHAGLPHAPGRWPEIRIIRRAPGARPAVSARPASASKRTLGWREPQRSFRAGGRMGRAPPETVWRVPVQVSCGSQLAPESPPWSARCARRTRGYGGPAPDAKLGRRQPIRAQATRRQVRGVSGIAGNGVVDTRGGGD